MPMREIVGLLRDLVDSSGCQLKGLQQLLLAQHREGPRPPSYQVLSDRLRGRGLQNNASLIYVIIEVLAPPERKEAMAEEVRRHLVNARAVPAVRSPQTSREPTPGTPDPELVDVLRENRGLRSKVDRMERRLARKEKDLQALRDQLAAVERRAPASSVGPRDEPTAVAPPSPEERVAAARSGNADLAAATSGPSFAVGAGTGSGSSDVATVADALRGMPTLEATTANALRYAFDSVLDGRRTGRFDPATLGKSERAYLGAKVTHELMAAWGFQPGQETDLLIGRQEVALKFTTGATWTVAPEEVGRVCLLVSANDQRSRWSLGLVRIESGHLSRTANRDFKRTLSAAGRQAIIWIFHNAQLPENTLLHLPAPLREQIFATEVGEGSSQTRTNNLFKLAQGRILNRTTVSTVSVTADGPKRVRAAREALRSDGILVLGGTSRQATIARNLGLPVPRDGEWISRRVTRRRPEHGDAPSIALSDDVWTLAGPDDPVEKAPSLASLW
ncbi:NaeI family type II restriction endonuclease [Streptomyces sp. NBC_00063]|uniref:NaeI family type II restriction endonuclease n=1 Tax=Streptomyces sp. NBC_00063 TaxID=2975638 RepID=UPI00225448B9|nr:NaeI family type II restriction endonuclease [Streptomyces sp. NBC_00063]MCX5441269.1 NaeI family type II restriction endonuclease [Streptomyces sp. NBC_00063]